ncbi:DMT family transporter [Candidatus Thorarchaeota archaeon]|nr:MAG: DMT family transporter [Candidatus Thorarchaeota archaeon]
MQLTPDAIIGIAAGLIGAALYALSVVIYRSKADDVRAIMVGAIKMWVALPLMAVLALVLFGSSAFSIPLETSILLALSISLGAVIGDTLYLISQERIGVSYALPIAMSFPILTHVFTIVFLGELFIPSRFLGAFVAVAGIVLLSREQARIDPDTELRGHFDALGILLAVLTSLLYAIGTTILQVGVTDVDPISGNFIRVLTGSILFIPMVILANRKGMPFPTKQTTRLIAIAGFFGMGIGSLLYVIAVKYVGAAVMSVISSSAPLFAVPVSVFYLKERITKWGIVGVTCTIIGVALVVLGI